jgi:tRNA threonylcarbamoyladenosine biosynthesis protein TsaB
MADLHYPAAPAASPLASDQPPACLLALDLSADFASVALYCSGQGEGGWFSEDAPGGAASSANLLPAAERVLSRAGISISEVEAVAFGAGPGAFTGVRTAAAVAQGLAVARSLPVVPVGSLEALAFSVFTEFEGPDQVFAITDARMGEVYFAAYERGDASKPMTTLIEPGVAAPEVAWASALALLQPQVCIVGAVHFVPAGSHKRVERALTARMVGELALKRWPQSVDAALAQPAYVRNKVAQTTAERAVANQIQAKQIQANQEQAAQEKRNAALATGNGA